MTIFTPEQYGAKANGGDDTAALLKCIDAARKDPSPEIDLHGVYGISNQLNIDFPVVIKGLVPNAGFKAVKQLPTEAECILQIVGGDNFKEVNILSNYPYLTKTLKVEAGHGIVAGDVVHIANFTGFMNDRREVLIKVAGVSGQTLTLAKGVPFPIKIAYKATVGKVTFKSGLYIDNVSFDAGTFSDFGGLLVKNFADSTIKNIYTQGFKATAQTISAFAQEYRFMYGGKFQYLKDNGSGQGPMDSIKFLDFSETTVSDVTVNGSKGFGVGITYCSYNKFIRIKSDGAIARGVKLFGCCGNSLNTITAINGHKTGISLAAGCSYNLFNVTVAKNNVQSGHWLNGTENCNNIFTTVTSIGNHPDITVESTAGLIDKNNVFANVLEVGIKNIDPATNTIFK